MSTKKKKIVTNNNNNTEQQQIKIIILNYLDINLLRIMNRRVQLTDSTWVWPTTSEPYVSSRQ